MPARIPFAVPYRPTLLALCCSLSLSAHASQETGTLELGATTVSAEAPAPGALPPVYAGGQVARGAQLGVLGNQDIMDVPFSMSSYTEKLIRDRQAETIGDVLLNDSSVRQASGYANQAQTFMIRGLPLAGDDMSFNGLYGILPRQIMSTDALERVEVFKGPNAFINGVTPTGSGIGGGVNLQPKRADDLPLRRFSTDISSDGRVGEHLDIGQRFGEDNQVGARVNLSQREGDTGIDDENQRSKLFTVGLDYRGDALRLSSDFVYQKQRINGGRNSVFLGTATHVPDAPSADTNYAPSWSSTNLEDTLGMLRAEYDLNDNWTAYAAGGAKHTREMGRYSSVTLTDNSGNALASRSTIAHEEDNRSLMGGLNGSFQTGPVSHRLNFGLAGIWTQARNAYVFNASSTATRTNIYDPVTGAPPTLNNPRNTPGTDFSDPTITGKTFVRSAAVSDTLGFFDDRLLVTLGARRQQMVVQAYNYMSGTRTSNYDESITTPVYGLVFKPWQHVSFYANRIEGLAQGPTSPVNSGNRTIIGGGQAFAPARSKQIEAGVKVDMGTYGATLGVYRIEQPGAGYVQVIDATTARYVREGQQINKGVELNVFGEPLSGLRLLGGVTVMKTELKDTQNGANDGNRAIGVPSFQLNADVEWDVPGLQGVTLNGRWLRTGGQYADAANNLSLPTWNRFDIGARYNFKVAKRDVTLGATVENVANTKYWESAQGGFLSQGDPRVAKLSATVDF
ncbi:MULTISPECIES: TonB-dependent receptor [unclassified Pseudomonas]|jgi:iron complex outermembrane receptor protein|uniref:TonB-dependent receptor n=1 Tax=unclassified Pseudomonas TaxID=196821 RepID=UPI0008C60CF6|nr:MULTISPECIES: TonB-dependent siderophore receptor [unclassified Pseudomonas]PMV19132.1 TonB-dependent siderophore receptor [Pseudomonas sp. FW305-3-2-15-C-TSA2]PMV22481.1 TonB-dependent siderophore receptor [Pseudomonas sp. DP16D-L5]PMV35219.1 TonB-dependent siderophore receptor [Pseudomonas sp. FW305-3-2-15-A-LB2]PMV40499.1 TonB-dependent siderophore receptor [Pseudomonas sp. FW305-3-2-15-C-R2A1]PMV45762.1 TonB-dependent siderophore receptor [Pseudomonas sp. FW305-3-2-15-C-LB1]